MKTTHGFFPTRVVAPAPVDTCNVDGMVYTADMWALCQQARLFMFYGYNIVEARVHMPVLRRQEERNVTHCCKASRLDSIKDFFLLFHWTMSVWCTFGVRLFKDCVRESKIWWIYSLYLQQVKNGLGCTVHERGIEQTPFPGSFGAAAPHLLDIFWTCVMMRLNDCDVILWRWMDGRWWAWAKRKETYHTAFCGQACLFMKHGELGVTARHPEILTMCPLLDSCYNIVDLGVMSCHWLILLDTEIWKKEGMSNNNWFTYFWIN